MKGSFESSSAGMTHEWLMEKASWGRDYLYLTVIKTQVMARLRVETLSPCRLRQAFPVS